MDATKTFLEASLVHADDDAVMRQQILDVIRAVVQQELALLFQQYDTANQHSTPGAVPVINAMNMFGIGVVNANEYNIKKMAMRAIKEHFNNTY